MRVNSRGPGGRNRCKVCDCAPCDAHVEGAVGAWLHANVCLGGGTVDSVQWCTVRGNRKGCGLSASLGAGNAIAPAEVRWEHAGEQNIPVSLAVAEHECSIDGVGDVCNRQS
jgi:hypothetical protein